MTLVIDNIVVKGCFISCFNLTTADDSAVFGPLSLVDSFSVDVMCMMDVVCVYTVKRIPHRDS